MHKLIMELIADLGLVFCGVYIGRKWKSKAKIIGLDSQREFPVADIIETENILDKVL